MRESTKKAHGVVLRNAASMDAVLAEKKDAATLSLRMVGGMIDFWVVAGPTPNAVISQIQDIVGKPQMPPYWALGYSICKYGFKTVDEVEKVWAGTFDICFCAAFLSKKDHIRHEIPHDVIWVDIDHMLRLLF
jgi:alpha-glucosidase (family GH31 glycosyl hydrolase)